MNRYYDPTTDSFISVDPAVQSTDQPYVFVNGDPLNSTDPLGQDPIYVGSQSVPSDVNLAIAMKRKIAATLGQAFNQIRDFTYTFNAMNPLMVGMSSQFGPIVRITFGPTPRLNANF